MKPFLAGGRSSLPARPRVPFKRASFGGNVAVFILFTILSLCFRGCHFL